MIGSGPLEFLVIGGGQGYSLSLSEERGTAYLASGHQDCCCTRYRLAYGRTAHAVITTTPTDQCCNVAVETCNNIACLYCDVTALARRSCYGNVKQPHIICGCYTLPYRFSSHRLSAVSLKQ